MHDLQPDPPLDLEQSLRVSKLTQAGLQAIGYAQRVRNLVALGKLESQGDLGHMRCSEVRLPQA